MFEMLRALNGLSAERRNALMQQREGFRGSVNMPRIEYAVTVVETGQLPPEAPGDLQATGQVQTAAEFLRERRGQPAPGPAGDVKRMTKAQFIEFVGHNARQSMAETGVPASVTVAQAILETGWGKSTIGDAKNLFGIKGTGPAGSIRVPTKEFINGRWVTINAPFAKYNSYEQSITEHARFFLRNRRYARALQVANDPDAFAREIHRAGYATDPGYSGKLITLMRSHNLYRFDQGISPLPRANELALTEMSAYA
jgi:flagellum-specific peptidoglycan hydrolase FlgJ